MLAPSLGGWFSARAYFARRHLAVSGDSLIVITGGRGATGISWVEARDAAENSIMHRTGPHNK